MTSKSSYRKKMKENMSIDFHPLGDRFASVQCVGSSTAGKTYLAIKVDQGCPVILKEVDLSNLSSDQIDLLEGYITAIKELTCPNIVRYKAIHRGSIGDKVYLESEYCSLGSVQDMVINHKASGRIIREDFIWRVAAVIVFALEYLHTHLTPQYCSIKSYRCLRPSNILLTEDDIIKIDNFSATRLLGDYSSESLRIYIAPELLAGAAYGPAADAWSLGCILLTMCTLLEPLSVIDPRASNEPLDLSTLHGLEHYSNELLELIKNCLYISVNMRSTISQLRSHPRIKDTLANELHGSQRNPGSFLLSPKQSTFTPKSQQSLPMIYSSAPPLFSQMQDLQPPGLNMHIAHDQDQNLVPTFNSPRNVQSLPISTSIPMPMPVQMPVQMSMPMQIPVQFPLQIPKPGSMDDVGICSPASSDVFKQIHQICNQMAMMIYLSVHKAYSQQPEEKLQSSPHLVASPALESELESTAVSDDTALMIAVRNRNMPALLSNISQLKQRKADNTTALMIAAETGNSEALSYLLGEYRLQRHDGKTALMLAILNGHVDVARVLADFESKIQDSDGRTALMYACERGMSELINVLLDAESGMTDVNGYSALMLALQRNNIDGVRALAKREAMITLSDGTSPLIIAENLENTDLLELVREYSSTTLNNENASTREENSRGSPTEETHMRLTVYDPPLEYIRGLGQNKNNEGTTNLMEAARIGSVCGVKQHIYEKKQTDSKGWTALMKAAFYGKSECIPLLKEEIKMANKAKYTALMSAAGNGHSACVRLLLAEAKMRNWKNETALMLAIMNEQEECIKLLMDKEGSLRTHDGLTMLEYAVKHNKVRSAEVIRAYKGVG
ncbi:Ankyrin repeat protein [Giardia duodenalis]|uniref:Ankyrin repeat protein n=1 Tax=Giardia intestinalis TaxID=5741 RepID=V6TBK3_GIAIN|nr:Ankyrin repeat protein [Giardia intestinalis]